MSSNAAGTTLSCNICGDDTAAMPVVCRQCKGECCRECFCTTLMYGDLEPTCMHDGCRVTLPLQWIMLVTDKEWFKTKYQVHRAQLMLKRETALLQETAAAVEAYSTAGIIRGRAHFHNLPVPLQDNVNRCLKSRGVGFEGFDFDSDVALQPAKGQTIPCPYKDCRGFIADKICPLCQSEVCRTCRELKKDDTHKCDPLTLITIRTIYKEAKPCPKCAALISKISGCDQMFCTLCHTTFSWETGDVITGHVHNPHYFHWLFTQGGRQDTVAERLVPQPPQCEQYLTYQNLNMCFQHETITQARALRGHLPAVHDLMAPLPSHAHYYLAFLRLRDNILNVRATSGNHANVQPIDNRDLRVRLVTNEISSVQLAQLLVKRDFDYQRAMSYHHVYMLVYESAIVLLDNIFAFVRERFKLAKEFKRNYPRDRFFFETYIHLQRLLAFANECLEFNDKVYGPDERYVRYSRHPYTAPPVVVQPPQPSLATRNRR